MCKVIDVWRPLQNKICILYLDEKTPLKPYLNYRIEGNIYKPVPMSFHRNSSNIQVQENCIAIEAEGNFVGKEVEFVN